MSGTATVTPGPCEAGSPESTCGRKTDCVVDSHPVASSGFSLREPRNDKGSARP
ncbi:hypothetical protein SAMN05880592_105208 [Bosea sp. TND4EK4]|nr:hypothetical protein SAMN05880592_105208 [Bosea sp. TND4EK4]